MIDVTDANPFASPAAVNEGYQAAVDATKPFAQGNPKWDYLILTGMIITCILGMGFVFLAIDSITLSGGVLVAF